MSRHTSSLSALFQRFASHAAQRFGSPWAFVASSALVLAWALTGPIFAFSETWQLVINTSTTIVTFLMVFLIQSTQNHDSRAIHLKLDELIRASTARDVFADLEDASEEELDAFQAEFHELRRQGLSGRDAVALARKRVSKGVTDDEQKVNDEDG